MQLIKQSLNIDFLGKRKFALIISTLLIVVSLTSLIMRGLNLGIDFTGGTLVEIGYSQPVELQPIRDALVQNQFNDAIVQHFGTARDVMIRLPAQASANSEVSNQVLKALANTGNPEMRLIEFVGPQVGE